MVEGIRNRVAVVAFAVLIALTAFASFGVEAAEAHGTTHRSVEYAAWLSECYYGGYSWYDYYAHGYYYWDWC